jgi:predicted nucleic acid-binding protein
MAGRVVDLFTSTDPLPAEIAIDTNVIVERLASTLGATPHPVQGPLAHAFFGRLAASDAIGIVTPAVFAELLHIIVKQGYREELQQYPAQLVQRFGPLGSWLDLYKRDPAILQRLRPRLAALPMLFAANRLVFLDHADLAVSGAPFQLETELVEVMCDYGLDSSDALVLLEARRVPVTAIATFDPDLRRAAADVAVYTWG